MRNFLIIGILILASCDALDDGAAFEKSFVQIYIVSEELIMDKGITSDIRILFSGREIVQGFTNDNEEFERLNSVFGDDHYNTRTVPNSDRAVGDYFTKIEIVSDMDFDADHPAGTSLADIAYISVKTAFPYVASGYKSSVPEWSEHQVRVSEIGPDDLKLIKPFMSLDLTVVPEIKTHNLTVTFSGPEKTISQKLEAKFL